MVDLEVYGEEGACAAPSRIRFTTESDECYPLSASSTDEDFDEGAPASSNDHRQRLIVLQTVSMAVVQASQCLKERDKAKYEHSWFNSCNNFIYTPYQLKEAIANASSQHARDELVIDSDWWRSQSDSLRKRIQKLCQNHDATIVEWRPDAPNGRNEFADFYPHYVNNKDFPHPLLRGCYNAYHSQFEYRNFAQCISSPVEIVELSSWETRHLIEIARRRCLTGHALRMDDVEDFSWKTRNAIQSFLNQHQDTGIFVKTMDKSAKNDVEMKPLYTIEDVLSQLTFSRDVLAMLELSVSKTKEYEDSIALGNCSYLILLPWQNKIASTNEFRVFCQDHKVRAVAQQKWYLNLLDHATYGEARLTPERAIRAARAAVKKYEKDWVRQLPSHWSEVVLDIWVDFREDDTSENEDCAFLIEVNPGGRWASSGSSLFEWKADVEILHRDGENKSKDDVFVRIVDDSPRKGNT